MANYFIVYNEFRSEGTSYIELADISINKVTVNIEDKIVDRTDFLKYGISYNESSRVTCNNDTYNDDIILLIEQDKYYFVFQQASKKIEINDKIVLSTGNIKQNIYGIVTDVKDDKVFIYGIHLYETIHPSVKYTDITIFKFEDIKEYVICNEFYIQSGENLIVPIFLPKMTITKSATKQLIIHINTKIKSCCVYIVLKDSDLLDNSNRLIIEHTSSNNNNKDKETYDTNVLNLLYNGYNEWFVL